MDDMTTESREQMITENLDVVKWSIYHNIRVDEQVQGLGYDDLYQAGCLALCEAALSYDGSVLFKTYAKTVVRNRLIDHCRQISRVQGKTCYLENRVPDTDDSSYADSVAAVNEDMDLLAYTNEVTGHLQKAKQRYTGVTLKGIEAIELKIKGYSGVEIAALYGVGPNLLGAWISRARKKLKADGDFMAAFPERC
jgi:RNA polymerase sigma factor (sigma-70 family)